MKPTSELNVLAIDTSTGVLRLGLRFGGGRLVKAREAVEQSHGQILMQRIGELIAAAGLKVEALDAIAVAVGPGSFTGLRIGLAAAKGMIMALDILIVPVTTFEIAAARLRGVDEPVNVIVPLNRDECIRGRIQPGDGIGKPEIVRYSALTDVLGNEAFAAVGLDIRTKLPDLPNCDLSDRLDYEASDVLDIATEKLASGEPVPVADLEPLYLQKSQAEIKFEQRRRGK